MDITKVNTIWTIIQLGDMNGVKADLTERGYCLKGPKGWYDSVSTKSFLEMIEEGLVVKNGEFYSISDKGRAIFNQLMPWWEWV